MSRTRSLLAQVQNERPIHVAYAASITGDRAAAEDVVQEATLRMIDINAAQGGERLLTIGYFRRIVRNAALDLVRRRSRERRALAADAARLTLPPGTPTPEQVYADREATHHLEAALAELTPDQRTALTLQRIEGMRLADIASRLGVSVPTVHRLVRDALAEIAARMPE